MVIAVERKHREEAASLIYVVNSSGQVDVSRISSAVELEHWLSTGTWTTVALYTEGRNRGALIGVADALAQRDARIAELESALAALKPPGTVAVALGDWSVRIASFGLHEHPVLCREDLDDTEQDLFMHRAADIAARHHLDESKRYTATMLLTPVGE